MKLRWMTTFVLCCAMWLTMANVGMTGDGWFGSSKAPAANGVTTTSKKSWWPSWASTKPKPKAPAKKSSSMWSGVTQGTKNTWNKTTSFLNPFDNKPKTSTSTSALPKESAANSSGWFGTKKTETKEVATLSDFLGQEKPKW